MRRPQEKEYFYLHCNGPCTMLTLPWQHIHGGPQRKLDMKKLYGKLKVDFITTYRDVINSLYNSYHLFWLSILDFLVMLWVKLPVVDWSYPQSNTFDKGVEEKDTGDLKSNDSPDLCMFFTLRGLNNSKYYGGIFLGLLKLLKCIVILWLKKKTWIQLASDQRWRIISARQKDWRLYTWGRESKRTRRLETVYSVSARPKDWSCLSENTTDLRCYWYNQRCYKLQERAGECINLKVNIITKK